MKALVMIFSLLSFNLMATELYVSIDGQKCNLANECYEQFDYEQIEQAIMDSQLCFIGNPTNVEKELNNNAEFSDEFSYLTMKQSAKQVEVAYYDNFSYYDQGNSEEPTPANIQDYIYAEIIIDTCF